MVEDEESGRLNELVRQLVLDDEEVGAEPDAKAQPKPGAITPLGVRVDKGGGMLSTMGASNTLAEMDWVLSGLRHWNARRERELAEAMALNKQRLEEAYAPMPCTCPGELYLAQGLGSDGSGEEEQGPDQTWPSASAPGVSARAQLQGQGQQQTPQSPTHPHDLSAPHPTSAGAATQTPHTGHCQPLDPAPRPPCPPAAHRGPLPPTPPLPRTPRQCSPAAGSRGAMHLGQGQAAQLHPAALPDVSHTLAPGGLLQASELALIGQARQHWHPPEQLGLGTPDLLLEGPLAHMRGGSSSSSSGGGGDGATASRPNSGGSGNMSRPCSSSSSNGVASTCRSSSSSNGGVGGGGGAAAAAAARSPPSSRVRGGRYSNTLPLTAQASAGAVNTRSGSSTPPSAAPQAGGLASGAAAGSGAGAARQLSRRGSGSAVRRPACPLACPTPDPAATQPASAGLGEGRSASDEGGWVDGGGACLGVGGGAAGPKAANLALLGGEGGAGCSALLLRLEAELRALDAAECAPSDLITWAADMEGAMARMDALQTGYQVLGQLPAGSSQQRSEVYPGPCGTLAT